MAADSIAPLFKEVNPKAAACCAQRKGSRAWRFLVPGMLRCQSSDFSAAGSSVVLCPAVRNACLTH